MIATVQHASRSGDHRSGMCPYGIDFHGASFLYSMRRFTRSQDNNIHMGKANPTTVRPPDTEARRTGESSVKHRMSGTVPQQQTKPQSLKSHTRPSSEAIS